jgi:hypothetical protein
LENGRYTASRTSTVANSVPMPPSLDSSCTFSASASFAAGAATPLSLGSLDLFEHEFQSLELALDLPPQVLWQITMVTGADLVQARPAVATQRLERGDALRRKPPFDPVHVLDALGNQPLSFAMGPACVLALYRGYLNHAAGGPIAAAPCRQRPQQPRRVQPVGLGPSRPAVDLQAARVHHPAGHPLGDEAAMQPEPVVAGFVAKDDPNLLTARPLLALLEPAQQGEQASNVATIKPMR